jgi:hypothetical protein
MQKACAVDASAYLVALSGHSEVILKPNCNSGTLLIVPLSQCTLVVLFLIVVAHHPNNLVSSIDLRCCVFKQACKFILVLIFFIAVAR